MDFAKYKQVLKEELRNLPREENRFQFWREKTFHFMTLGCLVFGFIGLVASVAVSLIRELWLVIAADTFVYCFILFLHMNKRLPYSFRVYGLLAVIHFLGLSLLLLVDEVSAGFIFLFTFPVVAGILLQFRTTLLTVFINALSLTVLGILLYSGFLDSTALKEYPMDTWIAISINFICLNLMTSIPISVLISGFHFSVDEEKRSRELLWSVQLQLFQQQLNPHFLFNTLNSLRSLIALDSDKARGMVTDLSDFLRLTLSSYKTVQTSIKEEIEMTERYLSIQQIRFGNDLIYSTQVQPEANSFKVPSFLLQPLVENAVKFGMMTSPMPMQLRIEVTMSNEALHLQVINSGKLSSQTNETHCNNGLANIKARLDLMFPAKHAFVLAEKEGHVLAEITIKRGH